jgi:hypothetical protein
MSVDTVFKPISPTVLVVATAIQPTGPTGAGGGGGYSYRVRNLSANVQYFAWGPTSAVTVTAPAAGVPSPNTIGMLGTSVETFEIPQGSYVIASSATGFEFTFGQGS